MSQTLHILNAKYDICKSEPLRFFSCCCEPGYTVGDSSEHFSLIYKIQERSSLYNLLRMTSLGDSDNY